MKKLVFAFVMFFSVFYVFAQNWSLSGEIYSYYYKWDNTEQAEDTNEIYFGISVGKYFSEKMSVGIKASFDFWEKSNVLSVGPFFQYDFLKYDLFSFGLIGSLMYSRFNNSYNWNDTYNAKMQIEFH